MIKNSNSHTDSDSDTSTLQSDEEIVEWTETKGVHRPIIQIIKKKKMDGPSAETSQTPTIEPQTPTEKILYEQLLSMQQAMASLTNELNMLKGAKVEPTAPPPPTSISVDSHRLIKELLNEIRRFDGSSNVEYFLDQLRNARDQLPDEAQQRALLRKVIASRLEGEAARIGESTQATNYSDLANALRASFGQADLTYEQISEIRNNTRQGQNESIDNYVKRYEELHRRVQKSIDQVKPDYRIGIRYVEGDTHIRRFIQSLRPDIEVRLLNMKIDSLRHAMQEARAVDKRLRDDDALRNRTQKASGVVKKYDNIKPVPNRADTAIKNENNTAIKNEKKSCTFCNLTNHNENECWRKNPQLRNFQRRQQIDKGPPRKYVMDNDSRADTTPAEEEVDIMTSKSTSEEQSASKNTWWTPEPQSQL